MHGTQKHTSGVGALDELIDGVRVGDNLVITLDRDVPGDWLVDRYIASTDWERLIVGDTTGRHRGAGVTERVLDWSAAGVTPDGAREQLAEADRGVGPGASFVIDSLTALARRWGEGAALDLFLWGCPRLFRRSSVALWIVSSEEHEPGFLQRLTAVTQVVVAGHTADAELRFEVVKADGRAASVVGRSVTGRLVDGTLVDTRAGDVQRQRLGERLRDLRTRRGLGQAELARTVGISPSALSQAERGVRRVSAETLLRIWDALGLGDALTRGYRVHRRGGQPSTTLAAGVTGVRRSDDAALTAWQLGFAPRAAGRSPLFTVKGTETLVVLRGVLQVELDGGVEILHEGDTLVAETAAITAWSNPADTMTEVLWLLT